MRNVYFHLYVHTMFDRRLIFLSMIYLQMGQGCRRKKRGKNTRSTRIEERQDGPFWHNTKTKTSITRKPNHAIRLNRSRLCAHIREARCSVTLCFLCGPRQRQSHPEVTRASWIMTVSAAQVRESNKSARGAARTHKHRRVRPAAEIECFHFHFQSWGAKVKSAYKDKHCFSSHSCH